MAGFDTSGGTVGNITQNMVWNMSTIGAKKTINELKQTQNISRSLMKDTDKAFALQKKVEASSKRVKGPMAKSGLSPQAYSRRMIMSLMAIGFMAQRLAQVFDSALRPAEQLFGVGEIWEVTLGDLMAPAMEDVANATMIASDAIMGLPEPIKKAAGWFFIIGKNIANVVFWLAMSTLAMNAINSLMTTQLIVNLGKAATGFKAMAIGAWATVAPFLLTIATIGLIIATGLALFDVLQLIFGGKSIDEIGFFGKAFVTAGLGIIATFQEIGRWIGIALNWLQQFFALLSGNTAYANFLERVGQKMKDDTSIGFPMFQREFKNIWGEDPTNIAGAGDTNSSTTNNLYIDINGLTSDTDSLMNEMMDSVNNKLITFGQEPIGGVQ